MGNQRVTTNISTGDVEIITGVGDLLAENNLSDVDSAATSRTNLGLEIGTDVQEWSAELDTLASLTPTQHGVIIGDGADFVVDTTPQVAELLTPSVQATTSAGLSLQNSGGTTVATLGAGVGTGTTLAGGLIVNGSISGATISGGSNTITDLAQSAVTDLPSALNARAMAGGVYLDGTGTGTFSESVSLVDSVLTLTADITWDGDGAGTIFSQGSAVGGWFFSVSSSGQINFLAKQSVTSLSYFAEQSNASLEASRSYHVAVVVDFTTASPAVTFYVDGEPFASTTTIAATGTYGDNPTRNFGIGARDLGGTPNTFFKGTISNAAAFNTALTADQIFALAEYGLTGFLARNPELQTGRTETDLGVGETFSGLNWDVNGSSTVTDDGSGNAAISIDPTVGLPVFVTGLPSSTDKRVKITFTVSNLNLDGASHVLFRLSSLTSIAADAAQVSANGTYTLLTDQGIRADGFRIYNNGGGTNPTLTITEFKLERIGPRTALPMDDGNGPDLRDISGNGNNALLSEGGWQHLKPEFDGSLSRAGQDFSSSGLWIGARSLLPDNSVITGAVIDGQWISPAAIRQDTTLTRIYVTNTAGALTFSRTSGTSAGTTVLSITPSDDSDVDVTIYWKTVTQ